MNIGFIGVGNMGEALLAGVLLGEKVSPDQVYILDSSQELMQKRVDDYGVQRGKDYQDILTKCEVIILTVKPNIYPEILESLSPYLDNKHYLFSIAPGFDRKKLKTYLPEDFNQIVLFMSNTSAKIGQATTAAAFSPDLDSAKKTSFIDLFESFGSFMEIEESLLPTITSVIGSAPAIVYMLIEGLMQAAILEGISALDAKNLVANIVLSSAAMTLQSDDHPALLRDRICSPSGTTIEGIALLEKEGFKGTVIEAIHQMAEKARKMN